MKAHFLWTGLLALCLGCLRSAVAPDAEAGDLARPATATPRSAAAQAAGQPVEAGSSGQAEGLDLLRLPERELLLNPSWRRSSAPAPSPAVAVVERDAVDKAAGRRTDERADAPGKSERQPFLRSPMETSEPAPLRPAIPAPSTPPPMTENRETRAVVAAPVPVPVPDEPELLASANRDFEESEGPDLLDSDEAAAREEEAGQAPAEIPIPADARFQIQIMSTSDPEQAEDMRMQALLVFPGEHVEVVWDPPNYKVRVGALVTQEAAVDLKRRALRLGFQNAWVVPRRQP